MVDITFDQLIADLCIARGKSPEIGTWKIVGSIVTKNAFYLEISDGETYNTFEIRMPEKSEE